MQITYPADSSSMTLPDDVLQQLPATRHAVDLHEPREASIRGGCTRLIALLAGSLLLHAIVLALITLATDRQRPPALTHHMAFDLLAPQAQPSPSQPMPVPDERPPLLETPTPQPVSEATAPDIPAQASPQPLAETATPAVPQPDDIPPQPDIMLPTVRSPLNTDVRRAVQNQTSAPNPGDVLCTPAQQRNTLIDCGNNRPSYDFSAAEQNPSALFFALPDPAEIPHPTDNLSETRNRVRDNVNIVDQTMSATRTRRAVMGQ